MENITHKQHYVWRNYLKPWCECKNEKEGVYFIWWNNKKVCRNTDAFDILRSKDFYRLSPLNKVELFLLENMFAKSNQTAVIEANKKIVEMAKTIATIGKVIDLEDKDFEDAQIQSGELIQTVIEKVGISAIENLRNSNLSWLDDDEQKIDFLIFLCTQYFRTKSMKDKQLLAMESQTDLTIKFFKKEFNDENEYSLDWNKLYNYGCICLAHKVAFAFYTRGLKFRLLKSKNARFIVSDQPVYNAGGKPEYSVLTDWTPQDVIDFLKDFIEIKAHKESTVPAIKPLVRPPSICPGCPFRGYALSAENLRKKGKLFAGFGEIGCSTLLFINKGIDTVLCMGGSDSMRQGFCLSRPEMASKVVSVIGDSCECHSGLDATRNGVFRNVPGVKVILDNSVTAMTGGQPAPTSYANLAGVPNKFRLKEAIAAEKCDVVAVNAYDLAGIEKALEKALDDAETGKFTNLVIEGPCQQIMDKSQKKRTIKIDTEKCKKCGRCNVCPGIKFDKEKGPEFTNMCINCGGNKQICMQRCPFGAIVPIEVTEKKAKTEAPAAIPAEIPEVSVKKELLPESIRIAIRGIGGQGNLFFGKILSEVALHTPYGETGIVKGDTHGMAQLGGSVISTFACGNVYSPILSPKSADVLVVMETSEVFCNGFLDLLKPDGTIILNRFESLPANAKKEDYPKIEDIRKALANYKVIETDVIETVAKIGDKSGKTANIAMLGLMSSIEPFSAIPKEIWLRALMKLSPTDAAKAANYAAFNAGRGE